MDDTGLQKWHKMGNQHPRAMKMLLRKLDINVTEKTGVLDKI